MISIQRAFMDAARKMVLRFAVVAVLFSVSIFSVEVWQSFLQRSRAAVDGMSPYLVQLLRTNDVFDGTRQLNSLIESRSFSGFWLRERVSGRLVTEGSAIQSSFEPPAGGSASWWLETRRGSLEMFSRYPIATGAGGADYDLVVAAQLPVSPVLLVLVLSVWLLILFYWLLHRQMMAISRGVVEPIVSFAHEVSKIDPSAGDSLPPRLKTQYEELNNMFVQFSEFCRRIRDSEQAVRESLHDKAIAELAAQVAHDIRSPLAALEMSVQAAPDLPESRRSLIREAVSRIKDIANDLLERNRERDGSGELAVIGLVEAAESVVTEKRLKYSGTPSAAISAEIGTEACGLFVKASPVELKRALSNLVDNAVEALGPCGGRVAVEIERAAGRAILAVRDDGKGIPAEALPQLGARGVSLGKAGGSGLGLYHARTSVESWGGTLRIESEIGQGTRVTVSLPAAPAPRWFAGEVSLGPGATVVVVDDDPCVRSLWERRIGDRARVVSLASLTELDRWIAQTPAAEKRAARFLVDHEFGGEKETGAEAIIRLGIAGSAILVTSRFDQLDLQARCVSAGFGIMPKTLVPLVPLRSLAGGPDAVLLDDDPLVALTWKRAAESSGRRLLAFGSPEALYQALESVPRDIPIYVDSELGAGVKGEEVARELHRLGYQELHLATGHSPESFTSMPWIRSIVGKEPPWLTAR